MKQLKDIFEGIMDKSAKNKVGGNIADQYKFGTVYEIVDLDGEARAFNWLSSSIESKTSKLDYMSKETEDVYKCTARDFNTGVKNKAKINAFFLWLDNLDISKFMSYDLRDMKVVEKLVEYINSEMTKQGFWESNPGTVYTVTNPALYNKGRLIIVLANPTFTYSFYCTYKIKDSQ